MSKRKSWQSALDTTHLQEVDAALRRHSFPATRYDMLGLKLGLLAPTLDAISANNVDGCLRECLNAWLRKADNVESPTYEALIAALKSIGEKAVADGIEREKYSTVYDRSGLNVSDEEHAVRILNRHIKCLRQLKDPVSVATFLSKEGVNVPEETLSDITSCDIPFEERTGYLIRDVRKAIKKDHTKLRVFCRVCEHVPGNEDIGAAIMTDYGATFKTEHSSRELNETIHKTLLEFKKEIETGNPSDELLMKFKALIDNRYSIQIITASQEVFITARKCTNITTLVMKELNCTRIEVPVDDYESAQRNEISGSVDYEPPLLDMDKLTIVFECDHSVYRWEREQLLWELFGKMVFDVVKMCYSKKDTIICSFPSIYATLLMKIILQKSGICKKKGIKSISFGYAPVWERDMLETEQLKCSLQNKTSAEEGIRKLQQKKISLLSKQLKVEEERKQKMIQQIEQLKHALQSNKVEIEKEQKPLREKVATQLQEKEEGNQQQFISIQELRSCPQTKQGETDGKMPVEVYGNNTVNLYKPSPQQCVDAIEKLNDASIVYLHTLSLDSIRAVVPILIQWKAVKKLSIYETPWTYESIQYLCDLLDQVPLEQLLIEKSTITDEAVEVLSQCLQGNTSITHLYLHHNPNMTSASARSLSALLLCSSMLTHLSLWGTSITFNGANVLFDTLATNKTLQKLTLDQQHEIVCSRHANYQVIKGRLSFIALD